MTLPQINENTKGAKSINEKINKLYNVDEVHGVYNTLVCTEFDLNKVDLEYIVLVLTSKWFVEKWEVCSNGSGNRLYLQEELFLNTKIPLPKLEIQKQIIKEYKTMIDTIKANEVKINILENSINEYLYKELGINIKKIRYHYRKLKFSRKLLTIFWELKKKLIN